MPHRPRRPCTAPGCPELQPCPTHPRGSQHAYDRARGNSHQRGYDAAHRKMRETVLAEEPLCRVCDREPSTIADHIVPVEHARAAGWSEQRIWGRRNYQGLGPRCHGVKTARERGELCPCEACEEMRMRRAS